MIKRFGTLAAAIALASTALTAPAFASTRTSSFSVTATTQSTCTTLTTSAITLASAYDPFTYPSGTPDNESTSHASFSTNCTRGDAISWVLDAGLHCNSGSVSNDRALSDGASPTAHFLSYELYPSTGFTGSQWATTSACGSSAAFGQTGGGSGTANTISVYASIPGGQDAYVSSSNTSTYTDTVGVTLNY